jgi:hypothetical protein
MNSPTSATKRHDHPKKTRAETHQLDTPTQDGGLEVLVFVQRAAFEDLNGVDD